MSKMLIAYFSASGETARLAKTLAGVTGGDLFEIRPERSLYFGRPGLERQQEPQHRGNE